MCHFGGRDDHPSKTSYYPTQLYTRGGYDMPPSMFTTGNATLRIPAGETLSLDCMVVEPLLHSRIFYAPHWDGRHPVYALRASQSVR